MGWVFSGGETTKDSTDYCTIKVGVTGTFDGVSQGNNGISISFRGEKECHVVQVIRRTKTVDNKLVKGEYHTLPVEKSDDGSRQLFADPEKDAWDVDTASPLYPYYDAKGYKDKAGVHVFENGIFTMWDEPDVALGIFKVAKSGDSTMFEAYSYCLSDKKLIGVVHWKLIAHYDQKPGYESEFIPREKCLDVFNHPSYGHAALTRRGYAAQLFLPPSCIEEPARV